MHELLQRHFCLLLLVISFKFKKFVSFSNSQKCMDNSETVVLKNSLYSKTSNLELKQEEFNFEL